MVFVFFDYLYLLYMKLRYPLEFYKRSLLAFSGGQDSLFLLSYIFIMTPLKNKQNLMNLYLNHLIQKDNFYHLIHIFKISYLLCYPVSTALPFTFLKTERKSSQWRYLKFYRISYFYNNLVIWLAHTNTDHVEKFFLNLFRGWGSFHFSFMKCKTNFMHSNTHSYFFYRWS